MSLAAASSALRRYQIDLHCAGLPLERNIHSLPQPAGPVKVANGGHLSGTKKQVAGYDKNSWLLPWFENRRKELANRPLIRDQAFGDALDPNKLERLGRYEVHLDRKLERMLTMLLRQGPAAYYRRELIRLAKRSFMGRSLVGGPCSSFWL
jgi:hypothetical protein